jgi:hypothetical protein
VWGENEEFPIDVAPMHIVLLSRWALIAQPGFWGRSILLTIPLLHTHTVTRHTVTRRTAAERLRLRLR